MAQKVMNDNNLDHFSAHFDNYFTQKPIPQQCREIMYFEKLSTENPIGSMKNWGKFSCTLCMKERIEIIDNLQCILRQLINS